MKIVFIGNDQHEMYVRAFYNAAKKRKDVEPFLFSENVYVDRGNGFLKTLRKGQNKYAVGPVVNRTNKKLLQDVCRIKPDAVFFYRTRIITSKTIERIRKAGIFVCLYNNDNPFADYYPKYFWRHYVASIKYSNVTFVYRKSNIKDCIKAGASCVEELRSYYLAENLDNTFGNDDEKVPDVVFLGHYESDERTEYINALTEAGIKVGIPVQTWGRFGEGNPLIVKMADSHEHYYEILAKAKIALVFLSKINEDTYTRRCFEIPAVKTFMLAPRNEDISSMFVEYKEAVFYESKEEFVKQTVYYLHHDQERLAIASAGYNRVMRDGHSADDRVEHIIRKICEIKK